MPKSKFIFLMIPVAGALMIIVLLFRDQPDVPADPNQHATRVSVAASQQFHQSLNDERFSGICQSADPDAFESPCTEYIPAFRLKMGRFLATRVQKTDAGPSMVSITAESRFESGVVAESFRFSVDAGQKAATLVSYRAQPVSR
ncbi:MAG: hypothetical protein ACKV2U_15295 [Bryobacteraceae bacterium]